MVLLTHAGARRAGGGRGAFDGGAGGRSMAWYARSSHASRSLAGAFGQQARSAPAERTFCRSVAGKLARHLAVEIRHPPYVASALRAASIVSQGIKQEVEMKRRSWRRPLHADGACVRRHPVQSRCRQENANGVTLRTRRFQKSQTRKPAPFQWRSGLHEPAMDAPKTGMQHGAACTGDRMQSRGACPAYLGALPPFFLHSARNFSRSLP